MDITLSDGALFTITYKSKTERHVIVSWVEQGKDKQAVVSPAMAQKHYESMLAKGYTFK